MPIPPTSVLDASALLAQFHREPGAAIVETALANGAAINFVNWAEVLSVRVRRGGSVLAVRRQLSASGVLGENGVLTLLPITETEVDFAADLITLTSRAGLSLADRLCLATAHRLRLPVLTADQSWSTLPLPGIQVQIIR